MEILLWLAPAALVTLIAMAWVGWVGKQGRGEVDRDEAVRRLGAALEKEPATRPRVPPRPSEHSTGLALRRTRPPAAAAAPELVRPATSLDADVAEERCAS